MTFEKVCQNGRDFSSRVPPLTARPESAATPSLTHRLESLRLIRVAGADRGSFLQGQITQDIGTVGPTRSALFGWTTAQGRLLVTGQLFDWQDTFWLTAPAATAEALVRRLKMFVLRAKVTIDLSDVALAGLSGTGAGTDLSIADCRLPLEPLAGIDTGAGYAVRVAGDTRRVLVASQRDSIDSLLARLTQNTVSEVDWYLADIQAGLPRIEPETSELFTPQMVNLDLIGGVSFNKGCYTGQEIITRTRHLGRIKRRMVGLRCTAATTLRPGDAIFGPQRESGRVVAAAATAQGTELLAVIQLDEAGSPLFADSSRQLTLGHVELPYGIPEIAQL